MRRLGGKKNQRIRKENCHTYLSMSNPAYLKRYQVVKVFQYTLLQRIEPKYTSMSKFFKKKNLVLSQYMQQY